MASTKKSVLLWLLISSIYGDIYCREAYIKVLRESVDCLLVTDGSVDRIWCGTVLKWSARLRARIRKTMQVQLRVRTQTLEWIRVLFCPNLLSFRKGAICLKYGLTAPRWVYALDAEMGPYHREEVWRTQDRKYTKQKQIRRSGSDEPLKRARYKNCLLNPLTTLGSC